MIRVAIVDDHAIVRSGLRQFLSDHVDLRVTGEAADGREALAQLATHKPGLILLDLLMPGMDGFELLAELQRREEGGSVPVIILTAKDLTAMDHQRLSGPIEKVLQKGSLGHEQLLAEVIALMAAHSRRKVICCIMGPPHIPGQPICPAKFTPCEDRLYGPSPGR